MNRQNIIFIVVITLVFAVAGGAAVLAFRDFVNFKPGTAKEISKITKSEGKKNGTFIFDPPKPEDAPEDIKEAVMLGYNIIVNTREYAGKYVGSKKMDCTNCHFDGGREMNTLSLVGVAAKYPKYRSRQKFTADLETRTNGCFQRSMNGKPLPRDSNEMAAVMTYYHWISRGIPIYADIPWLGLRELKIEHNPDKNNGKIVYSEICSPCHGQDGLGTRIAPPLWGPDSYNDGAGMSDVPKLGPFAYLYMPKDDPVLTKTEALDVAAYVNSQPRPKFKN